MFDTEGSSVFPLSAQKTKIAIPKWMEGRENLVRFIDQSYLYFKVICFFNMSNCRRVLRLPM